jgi:predicted transposase YbfD/YdcC
VPASASSPIAVLTAHAGPAGVEPDADLLLALAEVPDPRKARGRRHRLVTVLGIAVAAVLAGARCYVAIAEWAHDLPVTARLRLGIDRRAPSESTIRRILQAVDPEALDTALSSWLAARIPQPPPSRPGSVARVVAVDGKSARGARGSDGRAAHLFAAFDHASGIVLGQTQVDEKTNEITAFAPLLDRLDLTDVVITADALHAQDRHAKYLHERGGHYVFIVKGNRPTLHAQLAGLPWPQIPAVDLSHQRGHGRVESRCLKLAAVAGIAGAGIAFPHAQLAAQILRRRTPIGAPGRPHTEIVYAVTGLDWNQIRPARLAEIIRGHWAIENRLHWIRDVVFTEDHSQIRTGNGPAAMATLRNFAVSRHRLNGATNIAAACRHTSRHPSRATALLT